MNATTEKTRVAEYGIPCRLALGWLPALCWLLSACAAFGSTNYVGRLAAVGEVFARSSQRVGELERALPDGGKSEKEREEAVARLKEKESGLAELKAAVGSLKAGLKQSEGADGNEPLGNLRKKLADMKALLAQLKQQKETLASEFARKNAETSDRENKAGLGRVQWQNLKPINVVLIGKSVVPITEEYFDFQYSTFDQGNYRYRYVSKATRKSDGETIDKALQPGGCLDKELRKVFSSANYVKFFVCPDAVLAYRVATEKVKARNFKVFWVPYDGKPIGGSPGGGGETIAY